MKTAVVYKSMTGHSKKMARVIAAALNTDAANIKDKPTFTDVELLFIVGGIYSGTSLPDMLEFVKTLDSQQVKKAALITSSVTDKIGQDDVRKILETSGIPVLDEYRCLGNFLLMKLGHPNSQEIQGAVEVAKRLTEI